MIYSKKDIGELVTLRQGFAINKKTSHHMSEEPTSLHLLRIGDMKDENFCMFVKDTIPEKFIAKESDIIYTRTGQVGLVFRKQHGVVHNNCFTVTTNNENVLNQEFLYYVLQEKSFYEEAINKATGAAQPDLPHSAFNSIQIFLPPIESQKKITEILNEYDDLIENNQKQIKLLEEAAQRLYKEWFVDLRFPGHENVAIVDGVPDGWKVTTISEIAQVLRRGISPKYNENAKIMVINQKCIRQTVVSYEEARMQEKAYPIELSLQDSDTVICSTGAGTLGRVGQIFGDIQNATLDSHVTLVRAKEEIGRQFLFWSLKIYQSYFMSSGKGSTNQLELSRDTIGSCQVLLAEKWYVEQFEKYAQAVHDEITVCSNRLKLLQEARDRLLPKLMSGEIEV